MIVSTSWRELAMCIGMDTDQWFPPRGWHTQTPAITVCYQCPVRMECLVTHLDESDGIWGGVAASRRAKLRRKLRGVTDPHERFTKLIEWT